MLQKILKSCLKIVGVFVVSIFALVGCSTSTEQKSTLGAENDDTSFPVTIESGLKNVVIPKKPERIVVFGHGPHAKLIDLGQADFIVGASDISNEGYSWMDAKDFEKIERHDIYTESFDPNLEVLAELKPDLIIFDELESSAPEVLEQTLKVAPAFVVSDASGGSRKWQDHYRVIAKAVGMKDKAEADIDEVESEFKEVGNLLLEKDQYTFQNVTLDKGENRINFHLTPAFEDFGLKSGKHMVLGNNISMESMSELDADVLFVLNSDDGWAEIQKDELFMRLPVVKSGDVIRLEDAVVSATYPYGPSSPSSLRWALDVQLRDAMKSLSIAK